MKNHHRSIAPEGNPPPNNGGAVSGAIWGAPLGAVLGGILGAVLADFNGGLIGVVVGAILGAAIGIAVAWRRGGRVVDVSDGVESRRSTAATESGERNLGDVSLTRRTGVAASSAAVRPMAPQPERSDVVRIPLSEERLEVNKRELEAGVLRLRKVVRTEVVHLPVELRREEIVVERVEPGTPPSSDVVEAPVLGEQQGDEIVIPLVKEEAVVQKEAKVFTEVHVHKVVQTEIQQVRETLRHEEIKEIRTDADRLTE